MRQTYIARLANLQAQIFAAPASESGQLIRQFLAHEAMTSRNLKHTIFLTNELAQLISTLPKIYLTGSLPYPPHYSLATLYNISGNTFTLLIYNQQTTKQIYSQTCHLPSVSPALCSRERDLSKRTQKL